MTDPAIRVRSPVPGDATAMAHVHVLAWRVGYRGIVPAAHLASLDPVARAEAWQELLARAEAGDGQPVGPGTSISIPVVADLDGRLVGIASYGPYRSAGGTKPAALSELWMLNVHPEAWGTGVARALIDHVEERLRVDRPEPTAALWVLERNARGRRFYEKAGWAPDGATITETIGGADLVEVRYVKQL